MLLTVKVNAGFDENVYDYLEESIKERLSGKMIIAVLQESSDVIVIGNAQEVFMSIASDMQNKDGVFDTNIEILDIKDAFYESTRNNEYDCAIYFNTKDHGHSCNNEVFNEVKKIADERDWIIYQFGSTYTFDSDGFIWINSGESPNIVNAYIRRLDQIIETKWSLMKKLHRFENKGKK